MTRARGEDHFRSGLVRLERIASRAARFLVRDTSDEQNPHGVCFDWSASESRGVLHCNCSCDSFQQSGDPCQHIWATLLEIDGTEQSELVSAKAVSVTAAQTAQRLTIRPLSREAESEFLKDSIDIETSLSWPFETSSPVPHARFHSSELPQRGLRLEVIFAYAPFELSPLAPERVLLDRERGRRIKRSAKAESALLRPFRGLSGLKRLLSAPLDERAAQALMATLLEAGWRVEVDGRSLARFAGAKAVLSESQDGFAFAAAFDFGRDRVSLRAFTEACLRGDRFVALGEGRLGAFPDDWRKRIELLSRGARFSKEGFLLLSRSTLPLFKPVFEEMPGLIMDVRTKEIFAGLKDLAITGQAEKPSGLHADLRQYQAEGLFWLEKIAASGFGGILADDMGLGKTVQVIAYLLRRANQHKNEPSQRRPSLVVLPKSLVFNWLLEIEKFGPRLKVLDFASAKRGLFRPQDYDVVLTTYHVLKNELDRLEKVDFDTIILDEAQAIKNPHSQVAEAVFHLKGRHRFALSGTPIENSLRDLFSLMHFANPGLLPASIVNAIGDARVGDSSGASSKDALERLAIAVSPFILRRTKKQVLKELPDKCEQTLLCELDGAQKKLYEQMRRHYKATLKKEVGASGDGAGANGTRAFAKADMKVFEALLRLRQISCHPGLVDKEKARQSSTKFDVLLEHLEEIRARGHKALVFSQFTSLLELLKPHLQKAGLRFEYLDGQTRDRGAVVERFNSDETTTVFLISLKAGGTGLNLTTASYVFLLDPWWNPAIESQAIDRAYRMGQKQKVMAYRLIAEGTIEEKIMRLQAQKRTLADTVISEDASLLRALSVDELASLFD